MDDDQKKEAEEEKDDDGALIASGMKRVKQAEELRGKIDTAQDLKEKIGELRDSMQEANTTAAQSGGHFWAYVGVAVAAAPIVLFGLNKYFDFKINPAYYFDRIKGQVEKYTQGETITLSGTIGIRNQGNSGEYFYCLIDAANLTGEATISGVVTGPGELEERFSLKTGTPGARFGAVAQNQIVFEFDPPSGAKGRFICNVSEMRDSGGSVIQGAAGTVAVLNVE